MEQKRHSTRYMVTVEKVWNFTPNLFIFNEYELITLIIFLIYIYTKSEVFYGHFIMDVFLFLYHFVSSLDDKKLRS